MCGKRILDTIKIGDKARVHSNVFLVHDKYYGQIGTVVALNKCNDIDIKMNDGAVILLLKEEYTKVIDSNNKVNKKRVKVGEEVRISSKVSPFIPSPYRGVSAKVEVINKDGYLVRCEENGNSCFMSLKDEDIVTDRDILEGRVVRVYSTGIAKRYFGRLGVVVGIGEYGTSKTLYMVQVKDRKIPVIVQKSDLVTVE